MNRLLFLIPLLALGLGSCGIEEAVRRNDDRYAKPGVLDMPLTGIYKTYQYKFLDKYRVTHQWPNTSACTYSAYERPSQIPDKRTLFYDVLDIYEEGNVTKQRGSTAHFNRFVRSVTSEERFYTDAYGQRKSHPSQETGFRPLCFESWWTATHSLSLLLHKMTLAEFEAKFTQRYPEGRWSSKTVDGRLWRVQETDRQHLRPRRGVGGPYQMWVTAIGNSGYVIGLEMTASQDSLAYPQFFDALEAVYSHLIGSVRIEPLNQAVSNAKEENIFPRAMRACLEVSGEQQSQRVEVPTEGGAGQEKAVRDLVEKLRRGSTTSYKTSAILVVGENQETTAGVAEAALHEIRTDSKRSVHQLCVAANRNAHTSLSAVAEASGIKLIFVP